MRKGSNTNVKIKINTSPIKRYKYRKSSPSLIKTKNIPKKTNADPASG